MRIEIEMIDNGWLVKVSGEPTASDPLAQRSRGAGTWFADTREAVCGILAEAVLQLPEHPGLNAGRTS